MTGHGSWRDRYIEFENRLVNDYFEEYGLTAAFAAYSIVFLWYGALKLFPNLTTPVLEPVSIFAERIGIPIAFEAVGVAYDPKLVLMFIGLYEVTLGAAFLARKMRVVIPLFLIHQVTTLLTLVVAPYAYFNPPFVHVGGIAIPWMHGKFSAYVLKNLIFIGGFFLLANRARSESAEA